LLDNAYFLAVDLYRTPQQYFGVIATSIRKKRLAEAKLHIFNLSHRPLTWTYYRLRRDDRRSEPHFLNSIAATTALTNPGQLIDA